MSHIYAIIYISKYLGLYIYIYIWKYRFTQYRGQCFDLYGFDIMIDNNLKAWLLEVNLSPSLSNSSKFDKKIKTTVICDTLNLIGIQAYNRSDIKIPKVRPTLLPNQSEYIY